MLRLPKYAGVPQVAKDNGKSEKYRQEGNEHFERGVAGYSEALITYNKSICFAENGSQQLAFAYANRSAVYNRMNLFDACLVSIDAALAIEAYPARLAPKLEQRAAKCRQQLKVLDFGVATLKPELSYPAHDRIPFAANCVELGQSAALGKHLVTNCDLQVGETIAIEKPYCSINARMYQYVRCDNCTEENSRSLIPCETCTAVMFCGEKCRAEAMSGYHRYECAAIDSIKNSLRRESILPLRIVMQAFAGFNGNADEFEAYQRDINATVFDIDHADEPTAHESFAPAFSMVSVKRKALRKSNETEYDVIKTILRCNKIADPSDRVAKQLFRMYLHFKTDSSTTIHYQIKSSRDLTLGGTADELRLPYHDYSRGLYPFTFLAKHSCAPNVEIVPHGNRMVLVMLRPTKAGQPLFICHG